jgi:hypothetical protein
MLISEQARQASKVCSAVSVEGKEGQGGPTAAAVAVTVVSHLPLCMGRGGGGSQTETGPQLQVEGGGRELGIQTRRCHGRQLGMCRSAGSSP